MPAPAVDTDLWVRRYHPKPNAAVTLACFPHAGGSASFFFPVSRAIAPEIDVLAIQYPGRQDRYTDTCLESIKDFADFSFEALKPWLDRPMALFGHSMGAIIAFEVAQRMERTAGVSPVVLFASGRRAPSRYRDEAVHLKDDDALVAKLISLSGTDAKLLGDEEVLRMIMPAVRGDYTAVETYRSSPDASLNCPIVVYTGDTDPEVTPDEAADWHKHGTAGVDIKVFPGGHFFLTGHQGEIITDIAARVAALRESQTGR
jgi:surfactin synthase thioesterase subunit